MEWQQKLYEQERTPPSDLWPSLARQLEPERGRLSSRLDEWEVSPPSDSWQQITTCLSAAPARQPGILRRIYRYSIPAAAALLSILILKYALPDGKGSFTPATTSLHKLRFPVPAKETITPAARHLQEQAAADPHHISRQEVKPRNKAMLASQTYSHPGANYMEVCDEQQEACRRINYKLEYMAPCLQAQGTATFSSACRREWQAWLEQMERSEYVPAPGHFFDIVELAASLSSNH